MDKQTEKRKRAMKRHKKTNRRLTNRLKSTVSVLLASSMVLNPMNGIQIAVGSEQDQTRIDISGLINKKVEINLDSDALKTAALAAIQESNVYSVGNYLSTDTATDAAFENLMNEENPFYELQLWSSEEEAQMAENGVDVKLLVQRDSKIVKEEQEDADAPATKSQLKKSNVSFMYDARDAKSGEELAFYQPGSLLGNLLTDFQADKLYHETAEAEESVDNSAYELTGDETLTILYMNTDKEAHTFKLLVDGKTYSTGIKVSGTESLAKDILSKLKKTAKEDLTDTTEAESLTTETAAETEESTTASQDNAGASDAATTAESTETTTASQKVSKKEAIAEAAIEEVKQLSGENTVTRIGAFTLDKFFDEAETEAVKTEEKAVEAENTADEDKTVEDSSNKEDTTEAPAEEGTTEASQDDTTAAEEETTAAASTTEADKTEESTTAVETTAEETTEAETTKAITAMDESLAEERKATLQTVTAKEIAAEITSAKLVQYSLGDITSDFKSADLGAYLVKVYPVTEDAIEADWKLEVKELLRDDQEAKADNAEENSTQMSEATKQALQDAGIYDNSRSLDIKLVDKDGKEVEPNGTVRVEIEMDRSLYDEADSTDLTFYHLEEEDGKITNVVQVADSSKTEALNAQGETIAKDAAVVTTTVENTEAVAAVSETEEETENTASTVEVKTFSEEVAKLKTSFEVKRFSAIAIANEVSSAFTSVDTVDSKSAGVTMHLYDYEGTVWTGEGMFVCKDEKQQTGILENDLNADGYPVLKTDVVKNWIDLKSMFSDSYVADGPMESPETTMEVNHLFLASRYNAGGWFEYDSAENFATVMDTTTQDGVRDFKVYEQIAGPDDSRKNIAGGKKGNFFPFNRIGEETDVTDSKGRTIYKLADKEGNESKTGNVHFGLKIETTFYQPVAGRLNGEDMIFEFAGDDDLWVFIDGRLVLDLGGIHAAQSGSINFATGKVTDRDKKTTTIGALMNNKDGVRLDNTGTTFADGTKHTMKIFYLERGAVLSNLKIKFNTPSVPKGALIVNKTVVGEEVDYNTAQEFTMKLEKKNSDGVYEAVRGKEYSVLNSSKYETGVGTTERDGTFKLKHSQSAMFLNLDLDSEYRVEEVMTEDQQELYEASYKVIGSDEKETEGNATRISMDGTTTIGVTNTWKQTKKLTVSKTVTGDAAEINKSFKFKLDLSKNRPQQIAAIKELNNTRTDLTWETVEGRVTGVVAFEITPEELATAKSIDGIKLLNGTKYQLYEEAETGYVTYVGDVQESNKRTAGEDGWIQAFNSDQTFNGTDTTVAFTNNKTMPVPTGVRKGIRPYMAALVIALAGAALLLLENECRKRLGPVDRRH